MGIPLELKTKAIESLNKKLKEKGKEHLKCPVCSHETFAIVDGYTRRIINDEVNNVSINPNSVPSISLVCGNCGYILDFALGGLGLLSKKEE